MQIVISEYASPAMKHDEYGIPSELLFGSGNLGYGRTMLLLVLVVPNDGRKMMLTSNLYGTINESSDWSTDSFIIVVGLGKIQFSETIIKLGKNVGV